MGKRAQACTKLFMSQRFPKRSSVDAADLLQWRSSFGVPEDIVADIPSSRMRPNSIVDDRIVVYMDQFKAGLRLPIWPELLDVLVHYGITLAMVMPNALALMMAFFIYCREQSIPWSLNVFRRVMTMRGENLGFVSFYGSGFSTLIWENKVRRWNEKFFLVGVEGGVIGAPSAPRIVLREVFSRPTLSKEEEDFVEYISAGTLDCRHYIETVLTVPYAKEMVEGIVSALPEELPFISSKGLEMLAKREAKAAEKVAGTSTTAPASPAEASSSRKRKAKAVVRASAKKAKASDDVEICDSSSDDSESGSGSSEGSSSSSEDEDDEGPSARQAKVKTSNPMFGRRLIGPGTSTFMRWSETKAEFIINADIPDPSSSGICSVGSGIGLALQSKASFDRMKKLDDMKMSFLMGQKALELLQVVGFGGGRYRGLVDDLAKAQNDLSAAHAEVARVRLALRHLGTQSAKDKEIAELDQEASAEFIAKLEEENAQLKAVSAGATAVDMKKLESDMVDKIMDSEEYKASLQASFEDGVGCALKAFVNRGIVEATSIDAEGFKKECLDIAAAEDEEADAAEDADS